MGKFSRPFSEPKFDNSYKALAQSNLFDTDVNKSNNDFLLMQFRLFVDEVQNIIKTSKVTVQKTNFDKDSERNLSDDDNQTDETKELHYSPEEYLAKQVNNSLCKLIDVQNMELMRHGSRSEQKRFEDAKYIKSAVADELLLTQEWPGKNHFTDFLIETSLFGTSIAGEKIFEEIDKLIQFPPGREPDIERMYLFALAIGFEGKYKGHNSENEINKVLEDLFIHITRREPEFGPKNLKNNDDRFVSKQAYQHTISNIKPIRIFRLSKQSVIFAICCISLLIISQLLWIWLTGSLRDSLSNFAVNTSYQPVMNKNIKQSETFFSSIGKVSSNG